MQQPTEASRAALIELIGSCGGSLRFLEDALSLLRHFVEEPQAYALIETQVISSMARATQVRTSAIEERSAALEALDRAAGAELPDPLRQTLARARQAVQGALEEELLRGEA